MEESDVLLTCSKRRALSWQADACIRRGYVIEAYTAITEGPEAIAEGRLALDLLRLALEHDSKWSGYDAC